MEYLAKPISTVLPGPIKSETPIPRAVLELEVNELSS